MRIGVDYDLPICGEIPLTIANNLKLLGIVFSNKLDEITMVNYESKIQGVERVLNEWKNQSLTVTGKITVIKSLVLPKLTHLFTALPQPKEDMIRRLENMLYIFIWNGKRSRIKKETLCLPYDLGGQGMTDLRNYIAALKITWVKRAITTSHPWERIADCQLAVIGRTKFVWDKGSKFMKDLSNKMSNAIWKEVICSWGVFISTFKLEDITMGSIPLWKSDYTRHKTDEISNWAKKGLLYFNDLRTPSGEMMSFAEAKQVYNLPGTFLDYAGLLNSLSRAYVEKNERIEAPIIADQIKHLLSRKKGTKHIYDRLMQRRTIVKHWEDKWCEQYGEINWLEVYQAVRIASSSPYYGALHYKIVTLTAVTNKLLYKMGIRETDSCDRCKRCPETLRHKFWSCAVVKHFWRQVENWLNHQTGIQPRTVLEEKNVMLGFHDSGRLWKHIIIMGKMMKVQQRELNIAQLEAKIIQDISIEKLAAHMNSSFLAFTKKWEPLSQFLNLNSQYHGGSF